MSLNCQAGDAGYQVKVFDPDFKVIGVVIDSKKVEAIQQHWNLALAAKEFDRGSSKDRRYYKVDFVGVGKKVDGRWLYLKQGYIRRLSKSNAETLKIENASELNKLLGI